ncbi:uncharacterized protein [Nicotiana sylvestris]|uniref:uncharacterized protein n=1 Tax=Nicotiana sylvestris TaxID=4096 RepID=UPI00388CBBDB
MAMENFQCSMKLVHCLCLSQIFTNDRDSISFKIFGHDVSFTLEDFHIMYGLRITAHNVEKPINRESNILKRYFGKSKGVTLKDIRDFMTRNEIPKNVVNHIHVCESDDDVMKLMKILIVESILFGKKTESSVMEEYASIVEDDKVCVEYPWGNVAYEKLIYSLKHALDKQNKLRSTEYKLGGFSYPLCAWFYERFPDIREKYIREDEYLDTPQVPRMLRYRYHNFRVLDIIPTEEESNSMPLIEQLPCSRFLSKSRSNRSTTDFDDNELLDTICSRLTMEVQRHAEKEKSTIVKEVFDKFKKDERSAIMDAVFVKVKEYFNEKFEQLFKIVNKSNGMDDGNFDLSNYREYDRLSTENVGSKQVADNQVVYIEEHATHDPSHKVADDNATRKEAAVECDEHVQQQGGEEQSSVYRLSKDGNDEELTTEKGVDDQVVGTGKHAPSCALESDIGKGNLFGDGDQAHVGNLELKASDVSSTIGKDNRFDGALAIFMEILGGDIQEIVTTGIKCEVYNSSMIP